MLDVIIVMGLLNVLILDISIFIIYSMVKDNKLSINILRERKDNEFKDSTNKSINLATSKFDKLKNFITPDSSEIKNNTYETEDDSYMQCNDLNSYIDEKYKNGKK